MKMKTHRMSFGNKSNRITLVHMNKPIAMGLVGMLQSHLFSENIALVIDETPEDERDYDFACLAYAAGNRYPRILMERELFYDIIRGSEEARTILFHEVGHYANRDCSNPGFDNKSYRESRISATEGQTVAKYETAADDFAARYLGQSTVGNGLTLLLSRIRDKYDNDLYDAIETGLMIRELELRISRLQG